jgi:FkbM family methyltransferase
MSREQRHPIGRIKLGERISTSRRGSKFQKDRELFALLDQLLPSGLTIMDGGARNGTRELPRLARYTAAYSFEPNEPEFDKIRKGQIPPGIPSYRKLICSPLALVEQSGAVKLYVTKRPGATSTLRPNADLFRHFAKDNWSQMQEVVKEESVPGISLRDFMIAQNLTYLDYVKLDTQGNELQILQSGGEFLQTVSVVKTELNMIPLYRDLPLLGDVFSFLTRQGFQFVDLQWTHPCRRYHFSPYLPLDSYRLVWGDAIFAYDPFNFSGERKLEQAIILAELGYLDLALYIISNIPSLASEDKAALLEFYQRIPWPAGRSSVERFLKMFLKTYFPRVYQAAYHLLSPKEKKEVERLP